MLHRPSHNARRVHRTASLVHLGHYRVPRFLVVEPLVGDVDILPALLKEAFLDGLHVRAGAEDVVWWDHSLNHLPHKHKPILRGGPSSLYLGWHFPQVDY